MGCEFQNERNRNLCSEITSVTLFFHYYSSHYQLWSALKWLLRQHLCCLSLHWCFLQAFAPQLTDCGFPGVYFNLRSLQLLEGKGEWIISYIQQSKLELLMNACGSCNKHWRRETYWEADGSFQWKFKEGKMQDIASSLLRTMSFGVPRPTSTRTLGELSNLLSEQHHCCVSV